MENILAGKIARWCLKWSHSDDSYYPIIKYAIESTLNDVLKFIFLLAAGCIFGKGLEVFVVLVTFGVLRSFAGGSHRKTSMACFLSMLAICLVSVVASEIALIHSCPVWVLICILQAGFISLYYFSPMLTEQEKDLGSKAIQRRRTGSYIVLALITVLVILVPAKIKILLFMPALIELITIIPKKKSEEIK